MIIKLKTVSDILPFHEASTEKEEEQRLVVCYMLKMHNQESYVKNKSFKSVFFTQIYLNCVTTLFMGHIHEMGGTLKGWAEFRVK